MLEDRVNMLFIGNSFTTKNDLPGLLRRIARAGQGINSEPQNQRLLTERYHQIGEELGATVVPVGIAWQLLLAEHDTPALHAADGSHPTFAGSYLAACTFYAALFQGDPAGVEIDVGDLTTGERKLLQRIASTACRQ